MQVFNEDDKDIYQPEKECCKTCRYRLDLEQLDYTVGCKHTKMEGIACLGLAYEGIVFWMINHDEEKGVCEMYTPKQTHDKRTNTHECVKPESILTNSGGENAKYSCGNEPITEDCSMVDPLHDDCFDCDKFFTCDNKGEDYKTDCPWK